MPYRVDLDNLPPARVDAAIDRLIELGALDVERVTERSVAAVLPDGIVPAQVAEALGTTTIAISRASERDAGSVWVLHPRPVRIGRLRIVPADTEARAGDLRLIDTPAFGTGLHATTALCLEALDHAIQADVPPTVLDVGTGSGVLALAALRLGVPRATALDTDDAALTAAERNAVLNGLIERLELIRGGPDSVARTWPLVLANIVAATLIEIAPALARRVGHHGRLVLSGIPAGVEHDVERAYAHLGMRRMTVRSRAGWSALVMHATW